MTSDQSFGVRVCVCETGNEWASFIASQGITSFIQRKCTPNDAIQLGSRIFREDLFFIEICESVPTTQQVQKKLLTYSTDMKLTFAVDD